MEKNVTQTRVELKYLVPAELVDHVAGRLPACDLASRQVTTVYFDRMDRSLSLEALLNPEQSTKIRVREFHDGAPYLWIEVKTRSGAWTNTSRFRIDKGAVGPLLRSGEIRNPPDPASLCGTCDLEVGEAFRRLRDVAGGRLVAIGAVAAARNVYRVRDLPFRLTLDRDIAYYRVPPGLFETRNSVTPRGLGVPIRREPCAVLEIRHGGAVPVWCRDVVAGLARTHYSKFRTLVRAIERSCKPPCGSTSKASTAAARKGTR